MKIKTFGFDKVDAPADATLVLDCRRLHNGYTLTPEAKRLVGLALAHADENDDAVIAFGCSRGEERSVGIANYVGRLLGVTPEHTTFYTSFVPKAGSVEERMAEFFNR